MKTHNKFFAAAALATLSAASAKAGSPVELALYPGLLQNLEQPEVTFSMPLKQIQAIEGAFAVFSKMGLNTYGVGANWGNSHDGSITRKGDGTTATSFQEVVAYMTNMTFQHEHIVVAIIGPNDFRILVRCDKEEKQKNVRIYCAQVQPR